MQIKSNNFLINLNLTADLSDNEKLLLPTEEYYVLNHNEAGLIPCRPSHPDVEVSLYRDGRSNRGRENIVKIRLHFSILLMSFFSLSNFAIFTDSIPDN